MYQNYQGKNMNITKTFIYMLIILLSFAGCNNIQATKKGGGYSSGSDISWDLTEITASLVKKLTSNRTFYEDDGPAVAITAFYFLDNANQSNKLSMILADSIIHQMQKQGYRPIDYKLMPTVKRDKNGNFTFTKNMAELREKGFVNLVLIGTMTELYDGILINARIIDLRNGVVVSSSQEMIDKDIIEDIFKEPEYREQYINTNTPRRLSTPKPVKRIRRKKGGKK
jgi:TolB-like protein